MEWCNPESGSPSSFFSHTPKPVSLQKTYLKHNLWIKKQILTSILNIASNNKVNKTINIVLKITHLRNEMSHVWGVGGGRGGQKSAKKVSLIIWMDPTELGVKQAILRKGLMTSLLNYQTMSMSLPFAQIVTAGNLSWLTGYAVVLTVVKTCKIINIEKMEWWTNVVWTNVGKNIQ